MKTVHIYIRTQVTVDDPAAASLADTVGEAQAAIAGAGGDPGSVHIEIAEDVPATPAPPVALVKAAPVAAPHHEPLASHSHTHPRPQKARSKES